MTEELFSRAVELQEEIHNLENLKKEISLSFRSLAIVGGDKNLYFPDEYEGKILKLIEQDLVVKQKEFEAL